MVNRTNEQTNPLLLNLFLELLCTEDLVASSPFQSYVFWSYDVANTDVCNLLRKLDIPSNHSYFSRESSPYLSCNFLSSLRFCFHGFFLCIFGPTPVSSRDGLCGTVHAYPCCLPCPNKIFFGRVNLT